MNRYEVGLITKEGEKLRGPKIFFHAKSYVISWRGHLVFKQGRSRVASVPAGRWLFVNRANIVENLPT